MTNADTSMSWIGIKRKFKIKGDGVVFAILDNNESQTEIYLERIEKDDVTDIYNISS